MLTTNYYKSQDSGYLWRRGQGVTGAGSKEKLLRGAGEIVFVDLCGSYMHLMLFFSFILLKM